MKMNVFLILEAIDGDLESVLGVVLVETLQI